MAWYDGQVTNPSNGQVIADTGQLAGSNYSFAAAVHASVACDFELQQVASDGTTVLNRQKLSVLTGQANILLPGITATLQTNERLRVVCASTLALGAVGASVFVA